MTVTRSLERRARFVRRLGLLAALAICASVPAAAPAAASSSFAIEPLGHAGYYVLSARPGQVVTQSVRVINTSGQSGKVTLYPVDATTGQTSGAVYQSAAARRRDVGAWIRLSRSRLVLAPNASAVVSFTLRVPRRAFAGQHLGGLVAQPASGRIVPVVRGARRSFRVRIQEISIVAVQVNLPGPSRPALAITSAAAGGTPGYQSLLVGLSNTGNVLLKGGGRLAIQDGAGHRVLSRPFLVDTFVPHTAIQLPLQLPGRPLRKGRYRVIVHITYARNHYVSRTFWINVTPRQVAQAYGSTGPGPDGARTASHSSGPGAALIGGGAAALMLASIGGSALFFRSRYRRQAPAAE